MLQIGSSQILLSLLSLLSLWFLETGDVSGAQKHVDANHDEDLRIVDASPGTGSFAVGSSAAVWFRCSRVWCRRTSCNCSRLCTSFCASASATFESVSCILRFASGSGSGFISTRNTDEGSGNQENGHELHICTGTMQKRKS